MKTKKELNALKEEVETVSRKPQALSDDELERVNGGLNTGEDEDGVCPYGYETFDKHRCIGCPYSDGDHNNLCTYCGKHVPEAHHGVWPI